MTREQALARLQRGDTLRKMVGAAGPVWWFEKPYAVVDHDVALSIVAARGQLFQDAVRVVEAGDCLFGDRYGSQSYRAAMGGVQ